jgi:uncharacterized protein involved in response to NO
MHGGESLQKNKGHGAGYSTRDPLVRGELQSQALMKAFLLTGLLFLLLPGTFLGVWNLVGISGKRALAALSPSWLQAHGQAQVYGWIGSFILGIGFYSLTKMQSTRAFPARAGWAAWSLWTTGVALRWLGGVTAWEWRWLLPASGLLQLAGFLFFFNAVSRHRPAERRSSMEPWIVLVIASTVVFLLALVLNAVALVQLALAGASPALPHVLDQQMVTLAVWGILVPTIWGFNARWLPIFAGFRKPDPKWLFTAYALSLAGVVLAFVNKWEISSAAFLVSAVLAILALHVWSPAVQPAKVQGIHPSFPTFLRVAYGWLTISALMACAAAAEDRSGGLWGASRHALTVGFAATMVFAIGQRVLPAFSGMRVLWSPQLMFWSLALLNLGCLLRVGMEPLAYELNWTVAWRLLPVSAVIELAAVTLFVANLLGTLLTRPAHLRHSASSTPNIGGVA